MAGHIHTLEEKESEQCFCMFAHDRHETSNLSDISSAGFKNSFPSNGLQRPWSSLKDIGLHWIPENNLEGYILSLRPYFHLTTRQNIITLKIKHEQISVLLEEIDTYMRLKEEQDNTRYRLSHFVEILLEVK